MASLAETIHQGWKRFADSLDRRKAAEAELLKLMERDCLEETRLAADLRASVDKIPYEHLRRKLLEIAEAEEQHAELLRQKIVELGGDPPQRASELQEERRNRRPRTFEQLLRDLEEEKQEYLDYLKASFRAEDAGRPDLKELLDRIREEEKEHREELLYVLTRLNPLPE